MNERIQELAEQAGFNSMGIWNIIGIREYHERFAALIVKEMCQLMKAEGEEFNLDQNFGAVQGVGRCMRKIKEHFEVE